MIASRFDQGQLNRVIVQSRASPLPQGMCVRHKPCGSGLARDSGRSVTAGTKLYTNSFNTFPIASSANP
ncbi:hypothetical protein F7R14_30475 [Pseudomonas lini]|uniref:Uncharacterized protein n=1 Tax=Pseudomonas lini TaxID=163011 RepID=A0A7V7TIZ1_9PSED|nr:hypothetical protein F7R14_30475 [Pseudomonas lini]MDT9675753.1 hypothetical protein [Pseudomonas sp. JV414]